MILYSDASTKVLGAYNKTHDIRTGGVVGRRTKVYVRISNTLPFKLHNTTEKFVAGKTKNFKESWHKLTTDPWIRNTITGYQVEMNDQPVQIC